MPILLADLVTRLIADVPPQSGIPTITQYTQAVKDAVADLGRRASVIRTATVTLESGTAGYALPADFQALVRLNESGVSYPQGAYPYAYGVVGLYTFNSWGAAYNPFDPADRWLYGGGWGWGEQIAIVGDELIITPMPQSAGDRQLVYTGGDALTPIGEDAPDGDSYLTLTEDRAQVALLLASALCLERLASSPRADAIKLTTGQDTSGSDTLDTTQRGKGMREQIMHLRSQYVDAVAVLTRAKGLAL